MVPLETGAGHLSWRHYILRPRATEQRGQSDSESQERRRGPRRFDYSVRQFRRRADGNDRDVQDRGSESGKRTDTFDGIKLCSRQQPRSSEDEQEAKPPTAPGRATLSAPPSPPSFHSFQSSIKRSPPLSPPLLSTVAAGICKQRCRRSHLARSHSELPQ